MPQPEVPARIAAGPRTCRGGAVRSARPGREAGRVPRRPVRSVGTAVPTWVGGFPGMSTVMTKYMNHKMEELDIPSIPEFIEMISDTGAGLYACKASVDLFGLEKNDFIPQVQDIITVGEFYEMAAGGQIIFT